MFFFEGMKVLFRVALCIMKLSEHELLTNCPSIGELMTYVVPNPVVTTLCWSCLSLELVQHSTLLLRGMSYEIQESNADACIVCVARVCRYLRDLPPELLTPTSLIPNVLKVDLKRAYIETLHAQAAQVYLDKHPPKAKPSTNTSPSAPQETTRAHTATTTAGSDVSGDTATGDLSDPVSNGSQVTNGKSLPGSSPDEVPQSQSIGATTVDASNGSNGAPTSGTTSSSTATTDQTPIVTKSTDLDNPFSGMSSDEGNSSDDEHPVVMAEPGTLTERFVVDMDEL